MTADLNNWYERDFYGYGPTPPDMKWPKGAKIAVNFVINQEEGGERSVLEGDDTEETSIQEWGPAGLIPRTQERSAAHNSQYEYGGRVAIWRIMELFEEHKIPVTFFAVAKAFEANPLVAKYAVEHGHEVASHCYKWIPHAGMAPEKEEQLIRAAIDSFKKTTGKVPVGWYYGRPSARSAALVSKVYKELGHELLYWADSYADDIPFWIPRPLGDEGEGLVVMPYSLDNNDYKMWISHITSDTGFVKHIIDSFTTLRDEAIEDGKTAYMTVAIHSRWMGRPGRFQILKQIIEHMLKFDDVWFATREQIARHFKEVIPYEPKK